ncbi:unnamed protein product, partial [Closterium sp. NIES-54]
SCPAVFLTSSLLDVPDPESGLAHAARPTLTCLLAIVVTDPDFESTAAFALVTELFDFAARSHLAYVASLVTESESVCPLSVGGEPALSSDVLEDGQFELECLVAALPRFASMLLCPEGDPDALHIPTPRTYVEAIVGEYSSRWQTAMDAEMASWRSTGTYVEEVPPPGANIVDGMTTLASLGFAPSSADPSLFLRTDTSLPTFYDLVSFSFLYSSPQPTPLPTGHSLSSPPLDESVEPSGPYLELMGCLICEAEIYAGAMAAQELRWLTYLLINLGERPCSPPIQYVGAQNEAHCYLLLSFSRAAAAWSASPFLRGLSGQHC